MLPEVPLLPSAEKQTNIAFNIGLNYGNNFKAGLKQAIDLSRPKVLYQLYS